MTKRARRRRRASDAAEVSSEPIAVRLTDLAFGGEALGRVDGRIVFVPFGLPGEDVTVQLVEERHDFAHGRILELRQASPERVDPCCPYFGECGGCSLQHATYERQLEYKRQVVADQLRRIGHFDQADGLVLPAIGMVDPWHYRNHARFTVGRRFGELCFTGRGSRRLLRIECCPLMQPAINQTIQALQGRLIGLRGHQVAIRCGANTGHLLVNPTVPAVLDVPSGQDSLEEEIFDRRFRIASPSFFQVNTRREHRELPAGLRRPPWPLPRDGLSMAEILVLLVHDGLALAGDELVVDAFSGVGTFAVLLARSARKVIGIEESSAAVCDARFNARDLPNVEFVVGKTELVLPSLAERPDAVVLDPARVGCRPHVLEALAARRVPRVIYVSCDPATLARDLAILVAGGYSLERVQPLDMFPQTYHVECVAALRQGNERGV